MSEIRDSSKNLTDTLKASEEVKMVLFTSLQQTMEKLVNQL